MAGRNSKNLANTKFALSALGLVLRDHSRLDRESSKKHIIIVYQCNSRGGGREGWAYVTSQRGFFLKPSIHLHKRRRGQGNNSYLHREEKLVGSSVLELTCKVPHLNITSTKSNSRTVNPNSTDYCFNLSKINHINTIPIA